MSNKNKLHYVIFLLLIPVYLPIIIASKTVDPDAQIILPNLLKMNSVYEYILSLINLKTIDFQPIRDLTLSLDLYIFNNFGINTIVSQNLIWWIGCLYTINKIIINLNNKDPYLRLILLGLLASYPLFVPSIAWGMSRKHMLSFFFILNAIHLLIKTDSYSTKSSLKITGFYFLSVFSQPITILFPLWEMIYLKLVKRVSVRNLISFLLPTLVVFIIGFSLNFYYYEYSETFRRVFAEKTSQLNVSDALLAIGHYFFQIFFPFILAFKYDLGHFSVLIGLFLIPLVTFAVLKGKNRNENLSWLCLAFCPLLIVATTPFILSDAYCLLPAFALFMIIYDRVSIKAYYLIPVYLIFSVLTYFENKNWTHPVLLTKASFERRPNCKNAINYLRISFENYTEGTDDTKSYIDEHNCLDQNSTAYGAVTNKNFLINFIFFDSTQDWKVRAETLKRISEQNFLAHLTLIALQLKNGDSTSADSELKNLIEKYGSKKIVTGEIHPITAFNVYPYCKKLNWKECLRITAPLSFDHPKTYY